ncbi:MAG TPA: Gfo/Idh/MocA family oxidoreductase [Candidatus Omnitrophota bacterium]|nr:Gfo/Idh/MocA family oxidoreductase [Candidatus Omnitrophota bacterium]
MEFNRINIGVIGCGHWGPNHIRIFSHLPGSSVLMCADPDQSRLESVKNSFLNIQTTADHKAIFNNPDIHAVCIAAPTNTHYALAKEALECGKHVLCEKPLAMKPEECHELKDLAERKKKVLMVGHIFLFNAGIVWLKECIGSGELAKIHYAYSTRTNLGPFRYDVNALWDLAPHDISIFNYLFDGSPVNVSARGQKCLGESHEDLAFATLEYPHDILANVHVSWLDPRKVRQITIVGDKKMVVWDDLDNIGPIKLYDKHVEKTKKFYETYGEFQLLSKEGSVMIPKVGASEPLKKQGEYFLSCIAKGIAPEVSDASKGLDVVRTLCAIQTSMEHQGSLIKIS